MRKIPFIDIADTQCWLIYLMPFNSSDRTDYERVLNFQQECIKRGVFGMGWDLDCLEYGTPMTPENADYYTKAYNDRYEPEGWTVSDKSVSSYQSIKKGDYVVTRMKNGHYFVGKVSSDGAYYLYKNNDQFFGLFSWGGDVEEWFEYETDDEIPSEIAGRFSQRLHPTIQRVSGYRQRLLVISMYENKVEEGKKAFEIPKLKITPYNFVRSLTYMQLEDLVALYIDKKWHDTGYRLLPSSCKVSQQNYEFRFVAPNRKPITCQVKNQQEIYLDHYVSESGYEFIYIFSGVWDREEIDKLRDKCFSIRGLHIIYPEELFEIFVEYKDIFQNDFYECTDDVLTPDMLSLEGYELREKANGEKQYSKSKDFACFTRSDGLFYSTEFGALILSWHILDDHKEEIRIANQICNDLNNGLG